MKKQILLWIWCFPQNLVGLIVKHVTKAERKGDCYLFKSKFGSVSLGEYIFLCPEHYGVIKVKQHEQGHKKQSRMLGWLYIPVILIPSLIHAYRFRKSGKDKKEYYKFYTERWADKLAGIKRM